MCASSVYFDIVAVLYSVATNRCIETIDVCIWRMFVFMSVVVTVCGSVGMFVV